MASFGFRKRALEEDLQVQQYRLLDFHGQVIALKWLHGKYAVAIYERLPLDGEEELALLQECPVEFSEDGQAVEWALATIREEVKA